MARIPNIHGGGANANANGLEFERQGCEVLTPGNTLFLLITIRTYDSVTSRFN